MGSAALAAAGPAAADADCALTLGASAAAGSDSLVLPALAGAIGVPPPVEERLAASL